MLGQNTVSLALRKQASAPERLDWNLDFPLGLSN